MRYWKRLNQDGSIRTVESYSHDLDVQGAVEISEQEFNDYLASLPGYTPPPPDPDAARVLEIIGTSPQVIPMPEMWELLRIFARKLGYIEE